MSFINIRLATIDNHIVVVVEEIAHSAKENVFPGVNLLRFGTKIHNYYFSPYDHSIQSYIVMMNIISCVDDKLLKKMCRPIQGSDIFYATTYKDSSTRKEFKLTTHIYKLPPHPHMILIFLGLMGAVFNNNKSTAINYKDISLLNFLVKENAENVLPMSLEEYYSVKPVVFRKLEILIEKLISYIRQADVSLKKKYETILDSLGFTRELYAGKTTPFLQTLVACDQDKKFYDGIGSVTINTNFSLSERVNILLMYLQELIKEGDHQEINYIIKHTNIMAKEALFNPCINKIAHDKNRYTHSYTEWDFFRHAEFKLGMDNKIRIDVASNHAFLTTYAKGKVNEGIFKDEMIYLAKILQLEFDPATDFDKEIVFTKACSLMLKNMGLHLNVNYMKKLMSQKNHFTLFRQAYGNQSEVQENILTETFPPEIAEKIFYDMASEIDKDDLKTTCSHVWNNRL